MRANTDAHPSRGLDSSGVAGDGVAAEVAPSNRVDARFTALYERHGARFIVGHLAGVYTLVALIGVLGGVLAARFAGFGTGRALGGIAALELSLAVPIAWATWALRDEIRTMMRWAS